MFRFLKRIISRMFICFDICSVDFGGNDVSKIWFLCTFIPLELKFNENLFKKLISQHEKFKNVKIAESDYPKIEFKLKDSRDKYKELYKNCFGFFDNVEKLIGINLHLIIAEMVRSEERR